MSAADTPAIEICTICQRSAATLAEQLSGLTRLYPALAKATVMACPDLCIGCCIALGRNDWHAVKNGCTADTLSEFCRQTRLQIEGANL